MPSISKLLLVAFLTLALASCTGDPGPAGPTGPPGFSNVETYTGAITLPRSTPTTINIVNAGDAIVIVYTYLPGDNAWIQANVYAEDETGQPFLFEFAVIFQNYVEIYSGLGTKYRVHVIRA